MFTDGRVERSTQTTHHLSVSVGVNVSSSTPQMSYPSLLEKVKYNRSSRFFSDDMALTNGFQVMELLSRRETLKPTVPSQVEPVDDRLSLGSLLNQHLSFPPSPMPLSPNLHDPMSPAIHEPGASFTPAVSPDLFSGGEDIGPTPTEASQSFRNRASPPQHQESVPRPSVSTEANVPLMSELLAMMRDMQGQIKELKDKQSAEAYVSTPRASTSGAKDFQSTVSPQTPLSSISPTPSTSTRKKVSDIFKNYKFCPSPRKEQMPKKEKLSLRDQAFAISSAKGIACLQAERDEKIREEEKKQKKQMERQKKREAQKEGKAKPQGGGAKKSLKRKFQEVTQEEESSEESLSLEDPSQSPSSSDDSSLLFREQYQNEVLEVTDQDLNAGQTVMTKIQMKGVSQKGRKSAAYMSFLGQVSKVSEWKVLLLFFIFSYATYTGQDNI